VLPLAAAPASAGQRLETLRFLDPTPAPSPVVGFRLHVGPDAAHTTSIDIGNPVAGADGIRSYPLFLQYEAEVYLALTAYDEAGRESPPSNRIFRGPRGPAFDHDGDGASDLLRIDTASGRVEILRHGSDAGPLLLPLAAPPRSSSVARGDFDGSGTSDILWQRKGSRDLTAWLLGTDGNVDSVELPTPHPRLRLLGTGDLDGDSHDDLVFQDAAREELHLWFMADPAAPRQEVIPGLERPWRVVGIGDVEADRNSDLVWWDPSRSAIRIWHMNGPSVLEDESSSAELPVGAEPIGLGDYDADGTADLIMRWNKRWIVLTSLGEPIGPPSILAVASGAQIGIAAGHDFDGDGRGDLVVVDPSARVVAVFLLGPHAASPPPSDFAAASLSADLAREIGDSDHDWQPDFCDADFDNDGVVGISDLAILLQCLLLPAAGDCAGVDIDGDGWIGDPDLREAKLRFGEPTCRELQASQPPGN
jgi:hypothetical protein